MRFLINADCSLKSLRLQVFFSGQDLSQYFFIRSLDRHGAEAVKVFNQQHGTLETVSADQVDYTFDCFRKDYSYIVEEFASRVNVAKERALMMDIERNIIKEDDELLDMWINRQDDELLDMWAKFGQIDHQIESRHIEEKYSYIYYNYVYRWTWTLTPSSNRS